MAPPQTQSTPDACEGKAHKLSAQQIKDIDAQAHAFNLKLQGWEDKSGNSHFGEVTAATSAFWQQLGQLPIAERREMIRAFEQENQEMAKTDKALPTMTIKIDSDAFMEGANVTYPEVATFDKHHQPKGYYSINLEFQSYGMCAEFDNDRVPPYQPQRDGFTWGDLIRGVVGSFGK